MNGDAVVESMLVAEAECESKSSRVREVFENAPHYLKGRQVDIRFRAETVKKFAERKAWQRGLDIGCGDGTISLPLLTPETKFIFLDLSANMTTIVRERIPEAFAGNVTVRNENFLSASFDGPPFDLIVSVGVMAHVDSADEFLQKIRSLLRPGGRLILEFTDCRHFTGRMERFTSNLKELVKPGRFRTNRFSHEMVANLFERHNLELVSAFRYAMIPVPGIQKVVSPGMLYKLVSAVFGNCDDNRNAWLGNQYICLLTAK
jgi:SAM-dependent methyltransferase